MSTVIGLLRMDDLPEHALHVRGNYPDLYARMFDDEDVVLVDIPVHLGDGPASLDDADVWVFTGSRHSVYDDLPWIVTASSLVRAVLDSERPAVGICFGHQLFGRALGGTVGPAAWGIGAQTYRTVQPLPWFPEADGQLCLIASHQDQVQVAPSDAGVWSSSDYCPIAGLVIGERAWSVQGHPEFVPDVAQVLYEGRRDRLGHVAVDSAQASLSTPLSNRAVARAIVRFAG